MHTSKDLVDGKYSIKDLVDLKQLRGIFWDFTETMGFTIGFLSVPDLEILIATGWRRICTRYHRGCPLAAERCRESNARLTRRLTRPGQVVIEACENGLVDCATPIFIKGKRVAILATGQVLLKPPNIERFKRQAKLFGIDEKKYLAALKEIPVVPARKLKKVTRFLSDMALLVAKLGYAGLAEKERAEALAHEVSWRKKTESELKEAVYQTGVLYNAVTDGILVAEIKTKKFLTANKIVCRMFGYSGKEFLRKSVFDLHPSRDLSRILIHFKDLTQKKKAIVPDVPCLKKNGEVFFVDITATPVMFQGRQCLVGFLRDVSRRKQVETALRQTTSLQRATLESTADGILVVDRLGRVSDFNDQFGRLWHVPHTLVRKRDDKKLLRFVLDQLKDPKGFFTRVKWLYSHPKKESFDILEFKDGRVFERFSRPQMIEGKVVGRVWSFRDITTRSMTEEALKNSEARYRALFKSSHDAMMTLEPPSWKFTSCNAAMLRMFGAKREKALLARPPWALSPKRQPDGRLSILKAMEMNRVALRKGVHFFEWMHKRINGEVFPAEVLLNKVEKEGVIILQATVRDITERKRAEAALRESEGRYRALIETTSTGYVILDSKGKVVDANKEYVRLTGFRNLQAIRGRSVLEWTDESERKRNAEAVTRCLRSGDIRNFEVNYKCSKGKHTPVEINATVVGCGDERSILTLCRDITERKRAEAALRESEASMRRFYESGLLGIIHWDSTGAITEANDQFLRMVGYDRKDLREGRINGYRMTPPEYRRVDRDAVAELKLTGIHKRPYEKEYIRKDGSRVPIAIAGAVVDRSRFNGIAFLLDITERRKAEELLRKSSKDWQTTFDAVSDAVWLLSPIGRILRTNRAAMALFKKKPAEILGQPCCAVVHGTTVPPPECPMRRMLKSRKREFSEIRLCDRWFLITVDPIFDKDGSLTGIVHIASDITERKKADDELRSSEARLQLQFQRMPTGCILWAPDFRALSWNPAAEKIFGYTAREAMGRKAYQLIVPRSVQPIVKPIWKRLLEGDETAHSTNENVTKNGKRIFCKWTNTPIRDAAGKVAGILSMVEDITELKKAERAIVEKQKQLRQIVDTVPYFIFLKDKEGRFLLANKALAMFYGKMPERIEGRLQRDIHPDSKDIRRLLAEDQEVLKTGKPKLIEARGVTDLNGHQHIMEVLKVPFVRDEGQPPLVLGVAIDITERRQAEEFRNDIIRTVSHELRTPLSIEKEGVNLLLDGTLGETSPKQKLVLTMVMKNINRLGRMIDSLLDISHIEAGKLTIRRKPVDLNRLAQEIVAEFRSKAAQKNINLKARLSPGKADVKADPDKISQVISNLVDNAMKFTEKGSIEVIVKSLKGEVECCVKDTGIGMKPDEVARMFEKFQQFARVAGPGEKGLGLGLPICKGIIEAHGGRILARSEPGKGTQVFFALPCGKKGRG